MSAFRMYAPDELGKDGYPPEWHRIIHPDRQNPTMGGFPGPGIKHLIREQADHRCVRCLHPYRNGEHGTGEWSPCDVRCVHLANGGDVRVRDADHSPAWPHGWADLGRAGSAEATIGDLVKAWTRKEFEAHWRILTVHHLTGCWGREGDAKRDCRWWNLVAVCQRCHLTLQRKVDMHRVWPWEHSEWFRPYVAGYYAFVYLGEDLDRVDVEGRLDELLGLERAA